MSTPSNLSVCQRIIDILSPIADQDWHGKWRIQKAVEIAGQHTPAPNAERTAVSKTGGINATDNGESMGCETTDRTAVRHTEQQAVDLALANAAKILADFKPEGERDKLDEWQACFAHVFRQLNDAALEICRLKRELQRREISETTAIELLAVMHMAYQRQTGKVSEYGGMKAALMAIAPYISMPVSHSESSANLRLRNMPTPDPLHLYTASTLLFKIKPDGTIERGEGFTTVDEMSLKFWEWAQSCTAMPVSVSLEKMHAIFTEAYLEESENAHAGADKERACEKAGLKAVLEAAGVKYVD